MMKSWLGGEATKIRREQSPDGSWRLTGKYLRGHWTDFASGHNGNQTFRLLEYWRLTNDADALAAALKGVDFMNELPTPRGAQVWELSLHTPDIMGSSRAVLSNVFAYEATGNEKYLAAARRWAITGVPFVYRWERKSLAKDEALAMLYATTPVYGATNWLAPNWIGLPVQWCGLDYAYALIRLAPYDATLDWRKIAEGIVVSAEWQEYPDGDFVGLLPDSFSLKSQTRNPANINPCSVHTLRKMLNGEFTNVSVTDVAGRRVVAPFPARVENGVLVIEGIPGTKYQILVNGDEIIDVDSQGVDRISF
ncbi:MAG: hypothetical protein HUK22_08240 [Thermoguttaceae bacterium]|nr:hypothetical protein [Thermoguttaceae bacterium]